MKALIQRVSQASVNIDNKLIAEISRGVLVFVGLEKKDSSEILDRAAQRLLDYRIFPDKNKKMNLSVSDIDGEILLVSQFTLAADTTKGLRPSFSAAADPQVARSLYHQLVNTLSKRHEKSSFGQFGADMKIHLLNDGPVTFLLDM